MRKIYLTLLAFIFAMVINAQCPTFSISAPSGTVVGCNPNMVPLITVDTSGLSGITYTWSTSMSSVVSNSIYASANTYTIMASTPSSTCVSTETFVVSQNFAVPGVTVIPATTQSISCNGAPKTFSAVSSSSNIVGYWYAPGDVPVNSTTSFLNVLSANAPGTYTATYCNTISGCCNSQTVAVLSSTVVPTLTVVPLTSNGFTIDCFNPKVVLSVNSSGTLAPIGYTWTPLPLGPPVITLIGYTITVPGQYEATFHDGNFCFVTTTVNISLVVCTDIKDQAISVSGIRVYPNPVSNSLNIESIDNSMIDAIVVLDITGRKILEQKENTSKLNIENLQQGMYQLQITSEGKQYSSKFIKE